MLCKHSRSLWQSHRTLADVSTPEHHALVTALPPPLLQVPTTTKPPGRQSRLWQEMEVRLLSDLTLS